MLRLVRGFPNRSILEKGTGRSPISLVQFVAAAYPGSDGLVCVTADVSWQSSSPSVAAVVTQGPNAGLARGLSAGTTTVAATVGGITSTAIVTVE